MSETLTKQDIERANKRQEDLVARLQQQDAARNPRTELATTNSVLTTKEHVGNRPGEPDKPDEQEARKVGSPKAGPPVKTVEVSTHASGEATDTVVISPSPEAAGAGATANPHVHDAVGIGAVRAEALGTNDEKDKDGNAAPKALSAPKIVGSVQVHGEESTEEGLPFADVPEDELTPAQKGAQTKWKNAHGGSGE